MKVTQSSQDYLVLGDIPWIISMILIGMVLVFVFAGFQIMADGEFWEGVGLAVLGGGFAFLFVLVFARRSQVIFDRPQSRVTRRSRSFLGYKEEHWPLSDVERAIVQKMSGGDGDNFRPALLMLKGERHLPLLSTYAGEGYAEQAVEAINDWLAALDRRDEAP